jgi:type VI secretion system secreted protein VgrG
MMLCDSSSGHQTAPGCDDVPFYPPSDVAIREKEHVHTWTFANEIQPGKFALSDFDFENPSADLSVTTSQDRSHKISALEVFDYPGLYVDPDSEGKHLVRTRLETLQSMYGRGRGVGDVRGLHVGGLMTLSNHPRDDQNKEYLVVSAASELATNQYETTGEAQDTYRVDFEALDSKEPYRAPRVTPLPMIRGPQTATVVGPGGEEIWTDKYGRIKLQFHWDRRGKSDENSSYWVRVAQVWAGKSWGGIHVPRIGQEVIVEFLEGDPDQPIVTGAVYNAEQMPPYGLPDNATQSGLKSRSSKGGGDDNFNEIRMEDKKGSEELYTHAEKDHTNITENDRNENVGNDRALTVGHDKSESISNDKSITVGGSHKEEIAADKSMTVSGNHTETVGSNMVIAVAATLTETVGGNYAEAVGGAMELAVGGAYAQAIGGKKTENVGGTKDTTVGKDQSETVNGKVTETYAKDHKTTVSENRGIVVDKEFGLEVKEKGNVKIEKEFQLEAKKVTIVAKDELGIEVGSAKITMKKNGDITVDGKAIAIKASGDLTMKGSKIAQN